MMPRESSTFPRRRSDGGFTLIELALSMMVTVEVILGALLVFDFNSNLARVQTQVTDMQQSLRVGQYEMTRMARMAGRGSLPATTPARPYPMGASLEVRNNVDGSAISDDLAIGFPGTPKVALGTDVLTVRGVFSNPVYQLDFATPAGKLVLSGVSPTGPTDGSVQVCNQTSRGLAQDITPLVQAINNKDTGGGNIPEALVLTSAVDMSVTAVVELDAGNSTKVGLPLPALPTITCITVAFHIINGKNTASYNTLSQVPAGAPTGLYSPGKPTANLPVAMTNAMWIGILEEYRYYIRKDYAIQGNTKGETLPRLSRARMYPGTEHPYLEDLQQAQVDVADNVIDLQVALGLDRDLDGLVVDQQSSTDEWLFNAAGDNPKDAGWLTFTDPKAPLAPAQVVPLRYVRISTLGRTSRRDPNYIAPKVQSIEDHVYPQTPNPVATPDEANTPNNLKFRRRLIQTEIGVRNL
jgi:hypothetical protein